MFLKVQLLLLLLHLLLDQILLFLFLFLKHILPLQTLQSRRSLRQIKDKFTSKSQYFYFFYFFYQILAWEPSVAHGTHSFSRRVPVPGLKLRFYLFFPCTIRPNQLRISKPTKDSRGASNFPNQNLRQIGPWVHELWSDIQTDKLRIQLFIDLEDIYILLKLHISIFLKLQISFLLKKISQFFKITNLYFV